MSFSSFLVYHGHLRMICLFLSFVIQHGFRFRSGFVRLQFQLNLHFRCCGLAFLAWVLRCGLILFSFWLGRSTASVPVVIIIIILFLFRWSWEDGLD